MSNYKLEVENTEKLKTDIDLAFTEINTELKKDDDDLIAKDLFDVDKKISELKKTRKRWAEGTSYINVIQADETGYGTIIPQVSFKINEIFIHIKTHITSVSNQTRYYTILPYKKNNPYFSSVYLGYGMFVGSTRLAIYDGKTFLHYCNERAGDYSERATLFQDNLGANEFLVSIGNFEFTKDVVSKNEVEVSYIAFE